MRSYIKLYGPPIMKTIQALRKIALEMPQVSIMDAEIRYRRPDFEQLFSSNPTDRSDVELFNPPVEVVTKRKSSIISKSDEELGEYDFFFEWAEKPTAEECNLLIGKIDEAIAPLGCRYTITTK